MFQFIQISPFVIIKPKRLFRLQKEEAIIKKSGLFDQDYYLGEYPDLKSTGTDPLTHFILFGAKERRRPCAFFDTDYYLQSNPDVLAAGINPFAHFIKSGWQEGRKPHKHFSINFCLDQLKQRKRFSLADIRPFFEVFTKYRHFNHAIRLKQLISVSRTQSEYAEQEAYLKDIEVLFNLKYYDEFSNERTNRTNRNLAYKLIRKKIFDPRTYIENNHFLSVSNINLFEHYYLYGVNENLKAFSDQTIKRIILKLVTESKAGDYNVAASVRLFKKYKSIGVVCHSESNAFFLEMREYFVRLFQNLGIASESLNEIDVYKSNFEHFFIIAPHEFFWFFDDEKMTVDLLQKSSVYITEQPQSKFYYTRLEKVLDAVHVFDLNLANTWFYHHIFGKKSHFLPLGFEKGLPLFKNKIRIENDLKTAGIANKVKNYDSTIHHPIAERPVDLFFLGSLENDNNDNRRMRFFAKHSLRFSKYENLFYFVNGNKPLKTIVPTSLSLMQAAALAQRSKIMLNIHREDFPYFEWHRMVWLSIAQKCLVITEDVMDSPFFESGKHYLSAQLDEIPALVANILETEAGKKQAQKIVDEAYKILVEHLELSSLVKE